MFGVIILIISIIEYIQDELDEMPFKKYGFGRLCTQRRLVAIAQSYKDAGVRFVQEEDKEFGCYDFPAEQTKGWNNKMFIKADLMPHHIRITSMRQERLQDISDEDCMKEGIIAELDQLEKGRPAYDYTCDYNHYFDTPREAYASLIDKLNGKGTWKSNPQVFVYDFEVVD